MQFMLDSIILNHYVRAQRGKKNIVILFVNIYVQASVFCSVLLWSALLRSVLLTGAFFFSSGVCLPRANAHVFFTNKIRRE